jgi:hypothetical protein
MIEWPEVEEVEHLLDLGDADWITDHLQHALDAAIECVKIDVAGSVAAFDAAEPSLGPTEMQRQAALRAVAVMRVNAPDDGWRNVHADHIYQSLIYGQRRSFGVA